jgi:hypothetical protein
MRRKTVAPLAGATIRSSPRWPGDLIFPQRRRHVERPDVAQARLEREVALKPHRRPAVRRFVDVYGCGPPLLLLGKESPPVTRAYRLVPRFLRFFFGFTPRYMIGRSPSRSHT